MPKRIAYLIKVRCILNGADLSARLFLPADCNAYDALDAMRKYARKEERNSLRLLSFEIASDQSRPNAICPVAKPQCRATGFESLTSEDMENMETEAADKAERRARAMPDECRFNFAKPVAYNDAAKRKFHSQGLARLRALAIALELPRDSYDIRSNKGGIAVSGEITLHAESIYVQISQSCIGSGGVLVRTCNGRKDYTGGRNHMLPFSTLQSTRVLAHYVRRVMSGGDKMINSIEAYRESGKRAAIAVNENDWPRHDSERNWFMRAIALESPANRTVAQNSYSQAYSEARNSFFASRRPR